MEQQTFEGTWEEILQYAPELAGQRVRLTVLSPETPKPEQRITLDQTLRGRIGRVRFLPSNLSTRTKETFTDILADKHKSWSQDR